MEYRFTEKGKENVATFIAECVAKRKEILDAGLDTADETNLPDEEDILSDIYDFTDDEGNYINSWGVTDSSKYNLTLSLWEGEDFIKVTHIVFRQLSKEKLENVKKYRYGCRFTEGYLRHIGVDMDKYDISYIWLADGSMKKHGLECSITVLDKATLYRQTGYIKGAPTEENVEEKILDFIKKCERTISLTGQARKNAFKDRVDKRERMWL